MSDQTMTPAELGRIARSLSPEVQDALRRWAQCTRHINGKAVHVGTSIRLGFYADKPNTYRVDAYRDLTPRGVTALKRRGLVEEQVLWLALTDRGAAVAKWLAGDV